MPKAVFLTLPLHGHINPALPLVRELVGRGHAVTCFATPRFAPALGESGASYQPYANAFLADLSDLPGQTDELSWLLMRTADEVLGAMLADIRAAQPDYVITDSVAPWGQWIGRILRVPVVTSISTFAMNRHMMRYAVAHGIRPKSAGRLWTKLRHIGRAYRLRRSLCRRYGVAGPGVIGSVMGSSNLNIVYTSRAFQPCAETFDDRYQFIGPSIARPEAAPFPWERLRHERVVYISMGTLFNTDADFYRRCFQAFGDQDLSVILSTGASAFARATADRHVGGLGPVPSNFVVQASVPQLAVLRRARAFVSHGGMNSVNESLASGVPLVVVPQMSEQAVVGQRVAELGAGICLKSEEASAERLRESVLRLLTGTFQPRVDGIRESFEQAGGARRAADAISTFVNADRRPD